MAKVIFGNHSSVLVPRHDRDSIRKFYCDVLGGKIMKAEPERDFIRVGEAFYIGFLYGDVADESEFLRLHGLAGSAPLLLLTLTVVSSPLAAFSYIAVFRVGSMMGMAMMSVLLGVPARLTVKHFAGAHLALRGAYGLFSVGLGFFIVYENGALTRLFA